MAGLNFLNLGTALGGFMTGWDDARQKLTAPAVSEWCTGSRPRREGR
jgi:hypothetical protein